MDFEEKRFMNTLKNICILIIVFVCLGTPAKGQKIMSDSLQISLLTASPGPAIYEKYGHTAIRVRDFKYFTDVVFNYGLFSFDAPHFMYRFVKGETDYQLGITDYSNFTFDYMLRGSRVTEQILNLTQEEEESLFGQLLENYKPENRVYRYNFFFNNCSTKPRDIIAQNIKGGIIYNSTEEKEASQPTFREMIYEKTGASTWATFGIDLTLGAPADRRATFQETMFLPERLMNAFKNAKRSDGTSLVSKEVISVKERPQKPENVSWFDSPVNVCWLLLILVLAFELREWHKGRVSPVLDTILFTTAGIAGFILFFLNFFSTHPAVDHNYNCLWLQPFQLFAAISVWVKSAKKVLYYYHFVNFVILLFLIIGNGIIPQHFNPAFFPLIAILMSRSALHLLLYLKKNH